MTAWDYCWASITHGNHLYEVIWMQAIGKILKRKQERANPKDSYVVSVMKNVTLLSTFHVKNHVWYGISLNMMRVVTCQVSNEQKHTVKALVYIVSLYA